MEAPINNEHQHLWEQVLNKLIEYGLAIFVFIFSMVAKVYSIWKYRKRMTRLECFIDTTLSGLGGSIIIYILMEMSMPKWLFCFIGGFAALIVTPATNIISREATPILQIIINGVKKLLSSWFKSKNSQI